MITGKQINRVCKTLTVVNEQIITDNNRVIDGAHVSVLEVSTLDGSQVFGVEGHHGIDMNTLILLKLDDAENFESSVDASHYILNGQGCKYEVALIDPNIIPNPKIVQLNYTSKSNLDVKRFKKALDTATGINDHVSIWTCEDGNLNLSASNDDFTNFTYRIGTVECGQFDEKSKYPVDYLKKIVKVIQQDAIVQLGKDYPITISWTDEYCQYKYILAPRVDSE